MNSAEVLAREVKRKTPGGVFVSSVCDAYQPMEKRYGLTRECLKILIDAGFHPGILTKSKLVYPRLRYSCWPRRTATSDAP